MNRYLRYSVMVFMLIGASKTATYRGILDPSFGQNGIVQASYEGFYNVTAHAALIFTGRIITAGCAHGPSGKEFGLSSHSPINGKDVIWGGDQSGLVTTSFGLPFRSAEARALAFRMQILAVAGYAENGIGRRDFAIACYGPQGRLYTLFNRDGANPGTVTTSILPSASSTANAVLFHLALDIAPTIVAVGVTKSETDSYITLVCYKEDGSLNTNFNAHGFPKPGVVLTKLDTCEALAATYGSNNTIIVAGYSGNNFVLLRYTPTGELDTTFNKIGMVIDNFGGNSDKATCLAVQEDNKILIGGTTNALGYPSFACARYNTDGTLDTTFNQSGKGSGQPGMVITYFKDLYNAQAHAIYYDGGVFLAGEGSFNTNLKYSKALAQVHYNHNGTLDTSYGDDSTGTVITYIISYSMQAYGIARGENILVLAGTLLDSNNHTLLALAGYF